MSNFTKILLLSVFIITAIISCKKDDDKNSDPTISQITVSPTQTETNTNVAVTVTASDPDGDLLSYSYTVTGGVITGNGPAAVWMSAGQPGSYTVTATVDDGKGGTASATATLSVIQGKYKVVKLETDFGDMMIWLYNETPNHKANFLNLTGMGFYDSLIFHRVVYDFVIQGGDPEGTGYGGPGYTIPAEIDSSLHHVYGAVGAARLPDNINPDRDSNGSQFYIVTDPDGESFLDYNYTIFGYVFSGMDAAFAISQVAVDSLDKPLETVYMKKLTVEEYTEDELLDLFGFEIP
jgi:cyclophilin family peptidyl-prolyl cis-trans isomerase